MFSLKNKISLVTGGGSGIGKAISQLFAQQGAVVCIFDLDEAGAQSTIDELGENGEAEFVRCNVSIETEVRQAIERVVSKHGRIDILVNNAAIAHVGTVETTTEEDLDRLYSVNVKGVYLVTRFCIPHMKDKGRFDTKPCVGCFHDRYT
jgi:NAD(P)-dependent dehydrogenase (short-subunit alcohol dehydrogenase family)